MEDAFPQSMAFRERRDSIWSNSSYQSDDSSSHCSSQEYNMLQSPFSSIADDSSSPQFLIDSFDPKMNGKPSQLKTLYDHLSDSFKEQLSTDWPHLMPPPVRQMQSAGPNFASFESAKMSDPFKMKTSLPYSSISMEVVSPQIMDSAFPPASAPASYTSIYPSDLMAENLFKTPFEKMNLMEQSSQMSPFGDSVNIDGLDDLLDHISSLTLSAKRAFKLHNVSEGSLYLEDLQRSSVLLSNYMILPPSTQKTLGSDLADYGSNLKRQVPPSPTYDSSPAVSKYMRSEDSSMDPMNRSQSANTPYFRHSSRAPSVSGSSNMHLPTIPGSPDFMNIKTPTGPTHGGPSFAISPDVLRADNTEGMSKKHWADAANPPGLQRSSTSNSIHNYSASSDQRSNRKARATSLNLETMSAPGGMLKRSSLEGNFDPIVLASPRQCRSRRQQPSMIAQAKVSLEENEDTAEGVAELEDNVIDELRENIDHIFLDFLTELCSDLEATDPKGEPIHQVLMPKKMAKMSESNDFRPFKLRISAFTAAFAVKLAENGFSDSVVPIKRVKQYLWMNPYVARYNDEGRKAKSKGNHVWTIEARKLPDSSWDLRVLQPRFILPSNLLVSAMSPWNLDLKIWDPHTPSLSIEPQITFNSLPKWMTFDGQQLSGTPSDEDVGRDFISMHAQYTCLGRVRTVSHDIKLIVSHKRSGQEFQYSIKTDEDQLQIPAQEHSTWLTSRASDSPTELTSSPRPLIHSGLVDAFQNQSRGKIIS